jgi:hypothetical protein
MIIIIIRKPRRFLNTKTMQYKSADSNVKVKVIAAISGATEIISKSLKKT